MGGPNNLKASGIRSFIICATSSITSIVEIIIKQTAMVGDSNIRFKTPAYSETDSNCPAVSDYKIYDKDCNSISTDFENSSDLISSLTVGYLYAKLASQTPKTYEFCLQVSTSLHWITVPNLEFFLEANCKNAHTKVQTTILLFEQMFNSTLDLKSLISPS